MEAAARRYGFGFEWREFDWSCETYAKTGKMMPDDGLDQLQAPTMRCFCRRSRLSRRYRTTCRYGAS